MSKNFDSGIYVASATSPAMLNVSLSSANNSVVLDTVGTLYGIAVVGLLFNAVSPLCAAATWSLSASLGNSFRVDNAYHGSEMAWLLADGSSTLMTIVTSASASVQSIGAQSHDTSGPEHRRKRFLGYK